MCIVFKESTEACVAELERMRVRMRVGEVTDVAIGLDREGPRVSFRKGLGFYFKCDGIHWEVLNRDKTHLCCKKIIWGRWDEEGQEQRQVLSI